MAPGPGAAKRQRNASGNHQALEPFAMKRRRLASALALVATFLIAGCAHRTGANGAFPAEAQWNGRLALKVQTEPPQAFSADLRARRQSAERSAGVLHPGHYRRRACSGHWALPRSWLTVRPANSTPWPPWRQQATGAELPVRALFDWLNGQATEVPRLDSGPQSAGARPLASRAAEGVLPAVDLRIVLQR